MRYDINKVGQSDYKDFYFSLKWTVPLFSIFLLGSATMLTLYLQTWPVRVIYGFVGYGVSILYTYSGNIAERKFLLTLAKSISITDGFWEIETLELPFSKGEKLIFQFDTCMYQIEIDKSIGELCKVITPLNKEIRIVKKYFDDYNEIAEQLNLLSSSNLLNQ